MSNTPTQHVRAPGANGESSPPSAFVTTQWSAVLAAGGSDSTRARAALEQLCRNYWSPLYAYIRRRGSSPEDAQDLTQEFFARLLERNAVATVSPGKGRFRSFLLACLNHFLSDEWDKARAIKRGREKIVPLNTHLAERWLEQASADDFTPEQAFDQRWAITLLEQVHNRLAEEHRKQGKAVLFDALRMTLAGSRQAASYADLASQLGITEGAVKVAVHRLRQRYRSLLRETIGETVATPEEVEEELRYLMRVLAGG